MTDLTRTPLLATLPFGLANRFWVLGIASGALFCGGVWLVVVSLLPRPVRLSDALDRLEGRAGAAVVAAVPDDAGWADRLGEWTYRHVRVPLSASTVRQLALQDRPIADFMAEKAILAATGLTMPLLFTLGTWAFGVQVGALPAVLGLALAVGGWFLPDLRLRRGSEGNRSDAGEAVFTFFDLVTLERLANLSGTQALHSAASLSDHTVFRAMREALERARLEQRPPWQELKRVSADLQMPEISDVADVMRLDEQGAALSGALRARVRELRDQHLMRQKIEAHKVSESMTVWMVLPAMIFALIFLAPPLMKLMGS